MDIVAKWFRKSFTQAKSSMSKPSLRPDAGKEKPRHACPFYGFFGAPGSLLDTDSNGCSLQFLEHSPCGMEMNRDKPNWLVCPKNNKENEVVVGKFLDKAQVFAKEFDTGENGWRGIPGRTWENYVMSDACPRR